MSERPTYDQSADRFVQFVRCVSVGRRVWGRDSVGRKEVENLYLCPENPCVNLLHIIQGDDDIQ